MISNGKIENVVDPKLLEMPASKVLKRVALRCVDPDVNPRLIMGEMWFTCLRLTYFFLR